MKATFLITIRSLEFLVFSYIYSKLINLFFLCLSYLAKMFLEYLTNMYVLPVIATVIGLALVYVYDLFEKKQYTNAIYLRIAVLIYVSCLATIYISRLSFLQVGGSSSSVNANPQSVMPQPNEFKSSFEQFKTGIPTF